MEFCKISLHLFSPNSFQNFLIVSNKFSSKILKELSLWYNNIIKYNLIVFDMEESFESFAISSIIMFSSPWKVFFCLEIIEENLFKYILIKHNIYNLIRFSL